MAILSLPEEIAGKYSIDEILSWAESELKTMRQISMSKEPDKAFLLGRVTGKIGDLIEVLEALREKLKPDTKGKPPVVAG